MGAVPLALLASMPSIADPASPGRTIWAASRRVNGDADFTRELIDVPLLHRSMNAGDIVSGTTAVVEWALSVPTLSRWKPAEMQQAFRLVGPGSGRHPDAHSEANAQRVSLPSAAYGRGRGYRQASSPPSAMPMTSFWPKRVVHPAGTQSRPLMRTSWPNPSPATGGPAVH